VKVFATTRMDPDILLQFGIYPRIEWQPDDNIDDIGYFIDTCVQKAIDCKLLLHGAVPSELKDEICKVLRVNSRCSCPRMTPWRLQEGTWGRPRFLLSISFVLHARSALFPL